MKQDANLRAAGTTKESLSAFAGFTINFDSDLRELCLAGKCGPLGASAWTWLHEIMNDQ
jgi:hypothetical protein